jgi:signal transduction histidine kinase
MVSKTKHNKSNLHFDTRYVVLMILMVLSTFSTGILNVNANSISTDTIRIFGNNNFPPYEFTDKKGQPAGFDVDVMRALLDRKGIPYKITLLKPAEVQRMYKEGKADIILGMFKYKGSENSTISNIDDALMEIRRDGTYQKLYEKWFSRYDENRITKITLICISVILLLTLIFLVFLRILRTNVTKAKKELSDQNRRLALAIHAGDIKVFRYDVGKGMFYNVQWDSIPAEGRSMKEVLNTIHPADRQVFIDSFDKLVRDEDCHKRISLRTHVDNYREWRYIEKEFSTLKDDNGKITTIIGTQRDITERHKMKVQLQESISKMQCAIASSNLTLWEFSSEEMVFKSRNDKMYKVKGVVTENIFELEKKIHPDDKDKAIACIHVMAEGKKENHSIDLRMWYETDNEWHFCSASATPFETDDEGKVTRYVGSLHDNTQIIKLNEDLRVFSEKLNYTLLASGIRMWEYDINSHLFIFKSALNSTLETMNVNDCIKQVDKPQQAHAKELIEKMDNKCLDASSIQLKIVNSLHDNKTHYYIFDILPLRDKKNNIVSYFGLERDVTGLIQIQIKLEEEKQKAQTADKLKSAFLANMSHEIRTPLNAIVGFSQLLCDTDSEYDKKEIVDIIIKNNDTLLRLIDGILEQSKIEAGVIDFKNTQFDMSDNFNRITLSLQQQCTNPEVEFISSNPYKKCIVICDSNRLNQIIINLTANAIKNTDTGHIRVGYRCEDNGLKIFVEDTGPGIPEEDKARIFKRFEKLNDFIQGTGLGLPICKGIIDAYGGKIGVESVSENGSTFWAWIPCEITEIEEL